MTDYELKQRQSAVNFANSLLPHLAARDLKEITVAVHSEADEAVSLSIRVHVTPGDTANRLLDECYLKAEG